MFLVHSFSVVCQTTPKHSDKRGHWQTLEDDLNMTAGAKGKGAVVTKLDGTGLLRLAVITLIASLGCQPKSDDTSPILAGEYLGQSRPGSQPQIFAPGFVSTGASEYSAAFTPDGKEFYFAISGVPYNVIVFTRQSDDGWTRPEVAPFSGKYDDYDLNFSPDGQKLFFTSRRPLTGRGESKPDNDLWVTMRTDNGWSEPENLGAPINTEGRENYPSVTVDGTLYFHRYKKDGKKDCDVFRSRFVDGRYAEPERLPDTVNSDRDEWDPFIAPDESFLVFASVGRDGGRGGADLYVSFHEEDDSWTPAVHLGNLINSKAHEFTPSISPDGKYLFFMSNRRTSKDYSSTPIELEEKLDILNGPGNGRGDVYWIGIEVIEALRPQASVLEGDYLGQDPPGTVPQVFAPGIISTDRAVASLAFTPDGNELYFAKDTPEHPDLNVILFMSRENNRWSAPRVAPFSGEYRDWNLNLSPDGKRLYYTSRRPVSGKEPKKDNDIWFVERTKEGWSEPQNPGPPINTELMDCYASVSRDGALYYHGFGYMDGKGGADIYRSHWADGRYAQPENLGDAINSKHHDWDVFVAPDERYLLFASVGRPDGLGRGDLYVSFRQADESWSPAKNLGNTINSEADEICPSVSPDGKYLFFTSNRNGTSAVYWMDASVIEDLT
jgi:Tol biopolymer transport system component